KRASEGDRLWFKRHRNRAHRLRPAIAGELPGATFPPGPVRLAVVRQITPGTRLRLAMWATRPVCDWERCLAGMWEHVAPARFRELAVDVAASTLKARR